jgi:transcriptional regulator with XRE-family HTH domain
VPEIVADFGELLRELRNNHGYTIQKLSKMIGMTPSTISRIESAKLELPPENTLRVWLDKLGCGSNTNRLILLARQWRVKHHFHLQKQEPANPDILRIIQCYRDGKLTDYDRSLLRLVAR